MRAWTLSAAGMAAGLLAMGGTALAQAPGGRAGPVARPAAVARPVGVSPRPARSVRAGHAWRRGGRNFGGGGFAGGLVGSGLYGAGYGAGPSAIDASVRTYPSPDELAPAAWSYGTYGIPTVPGIAPPPKGEPVVYVIDAPRRTRPGARVLSRADEGWVEVDPVPHAGGARVVNVRVPAR